LRPGNDGRGRRQRSAQPPDKTDGCRGSASAQRLVAIDTLDTELIHNDTLLIAAACVAFAHSDVEERLALVH
jgi:hypothetical protein